MVVAQVTVEEGHGEVHLAPAGAKCLGTPATYGEVRLNLIPVVWSGYLHVTDFPNLARPVQA